MANVEQIPFEVILEKTKSEILISVNAIGQKYEEGDILCYVQASWGEFIPVPAGIGGKLVDISAKKASHVHRGETLAWIERES